MRLKLVPIDCDFPDPERLFAINDEAFPDDERIPSPQLLDILALYGCRAYAFYDEDTSGEAMTGGDFRSGTMVGFTTVMYIEQLKMGYIWYFAMASDCRDRGYGSACMKLLQANFEGSQLVLDMEQVVPTAENYTQRIRRLKFYERNGYLRTMVGITYFGMHLELMCWPRPFRQDDFQKLLDIARHDKFDPKMYPL